MTKRKQIDFLLDLNQEIREKYRSARANNRQLRRDIEEILDENERISDELRALQKEFQKVRQESAETAKERDELKNRADFLLRANEKLYFQKSQLEEKLTVEAGETVVKNET